MQQAVSALGAVVGVGAIDNRGGRAYIDAKVYKEN